jgi:hypothetical protein
MTTPAPNRDAVEKGCIIFCLFGPGPNLANINGDASAKLLSSRFATLNQLNESLKVMPGIVRAGSGFRMILNRDDGQSRVPHALDTLIVEINVSDLNLRREAVGLHGKAKIL